MDLHDGPGRVEPVKRLRHEHGVDACVRQRDPLGRAIERLDSGDRAHQLLAHSGHWLDGHDRGSVRLQRSRQLARSGGQVDNPTPRSDL
jgi:hypothetical protein